MKNDFVEIEFTGYANGEVFDSNVSEDLKKLSEKAEPKKTIVIVSQHMVVPGFDQALEGKEFGKQYEIILQPKDAFGERKRSLVKIIPLHIFIRHKINPATGMTLFLDNMMAKVIAVSGARITTDFNNPMAGKEITYKFTIKRKVSDDKEKSDAFFDFSLRFIPEFVSSDAEKIIVKGNKEIEPIIKMFSEKFKELVGKSLEFKLEEAQVPPVKKEQTDPSN